MARVFPVKTLLLPVRVGAYGYPKFFVVLTEREEQKGVVYLSQQLYTPKLSRAEPRFCRMLKVEVGDVPSYTAPLFQRLSTCKFK